MFILMIRKLIYMASFIIMIINFVILDIYWSNRNIFMDICQRRERERKEVGYDELFTSLLSSTFLSLLYLKNDILAFNAMYLEADTCTLYKCGFYSFCYSDI